MIKKTCPECGSIIEIDESNLKPGSVIVTQCQLCGAEVSLIVPELPEETKYKKIVGDNDWSPSKQNENGRKEDYVRSKEMNQTHKRKDQSSQISLNDNTADYRADVSNQPPDRNRKDTKIIQNVSDFKSYNSSFFNFKKMIISIIGIVVVVCVSILIYREFSKDSYNNITNNHVPEKSSYNVSTNNTGTQYPYKEQNDQTSDQVNNNCYSHNDESHDQSLEALIDQPYRELVESDIYNLDKQELRILRNSYFARCGYIFNDQELARFFSRYDWYKPTSKDVIHKMTEVQKRNVEFIKKYENL